MSFKSIHTTTGLQLMAQAEAQGAQIRLTHMAVGDGNGNPTTPVESQARLVRERFRATVNRIYPNPDQPNMFTAELIIPATEGGFTIREVGVFDSNGNLFIVGNLPETYKPSSVEGAFSDSVIRIPFMVTNASIVELKIDPNVVVATQSWIVNTINPAMLFPGGTTNQILRKKSNADGDTEWADPSLATIVVDVIEEEQTLVADQTIVTWADVSNIGLAVYIEGVRIPRKEGVDGWQIHGIDTTTKIVLGKAYPAGTKIFGVQNDPLGDVPFPLEASKNLADVPSKGAARQNLDVYSKAESDQKAPTGMIGYFAGSTAPAGWLKANGAAVSRTAYAALFAVIGTRYGVGDGFNTFNLPDGRGVFPRGWDDGRGLDTGRSLGSFQGDELKSHAHQDRSAYGGGATGTPVTASRYAKAFYQASSQLKDINDSAAEGLTSQSTGGTETRPKNIAWLCCIKF